MSLTDPQCDKEAGMSRQTLACIIMDTAKSMSRHANAEFNNFHVASVLYTLAGCVMIGTEGELAEITAEYSRRIIRPGGPAETMIQ